MKTVIKSILLILVLSISYLQLNATNKKIKIMPLKTNESTFLESESKYNFTETVEKLTAEIEKNTWKLSVVHDLQETLKRMDQKFFLLRFLLYVIQSIQAKYYREMRSGLSQP